MNIPALTSELTADPLGRGYATMNDEEATVSLNTENRTRLRDTLDGAEIFEATDVAEYLALSESEKAHVKIIWGLGPNVAIGPNSKARAIYVAAFGGGSDTITALLAVLTTTISRATELAMGFVYPGHVQNARM